MDKTVLDENITTIRQRWSMSQADFARLLGVTRNVVMNWERGRTAPGVSDLRYLAELAGLQVGEIGARAVAAEELPASPLLIVRDMKAVLQRLDTIEGLLRQVIKNTESTV